MVLNGDFPPRVHGSRRAPDQVRYPGRVKIEQLKKQVREARQQRDVIDQFIAAAEKLIGSLEAQEPRPAAPATSAAPKRRRAPVRRKGDTERAVIQVLRKGGTWSPTAIAAEAGKPRGSVSNVLVRLTNNGTVHSPEYGRYEIASTTDDAHGPSAALAAEDDQPVPPEEVARGMNGAAA
jgi:hypothetical protein